MSGVFFVMTSYIKVLGFQGTSIVFNESVAPLNDLAKLSGVSFFGILISIGALVSFFACTLASVNAGARVAFAMARHGILHEAVGRAHIRNGTPHIAVSATALIVFLVPMLLSFAGVKVLDIYGYCGTIATYGFLFAYVLISIAAPIYLKREHTLHTKDILYAVLGIAFIAIPVLGSIGIPGENSIFPIPPAPYNVFPYLFLVYIVAGAAWFSFLRKRSPDLIEKMERDIEASHVRFSEMKKI